jgi:hypothetical protein
MAKCEISIPFSEDAGSLIRRASQAIENAGGKFMGDENEGSFNLSSIIGSIAGTYEIADSQLKISISQKPMLVSCDRIEKELLKHLR